VTLIYSANSTHIAEKYTISIHLFHEPST